jgi:hypothetical protein
MHPGPADREFIHGPTHERTSLARELAPTQTATAQNWAVSMYNPRGGYVIGRVWKNKDAPDPTKAKVSRGHDRLQAALQRRLGQPGPLPGQLAGMAGRHQPRHGHRGSTGAATAAWST